MPPRADHHAKHAEVEAGGEEGQDVAAAGAPGLGSRGARERGWGGGHGKGRHLASSSEIAAADAFATRNVRGEVGQGRLRHDPPPSLLSQRRGAVQHTLSFVDMASPLTRQCRPRSSCCSSRRTVLTRGQRRKPPRSAGHSAGTRGQGHQPWRVARPQQCPAGPMPRSRWCHCAQAEDNMAPDATRRTCLPPSRPHTPRPPPPPTTTSTGLLKGGRPMLVGRQIHAREYEEEAGPEVGGGEEAVTAA